MMHNFLMIALALLWAGSAAFFLINWQQHRKKVEQNRRLLGFIHAMDDVMELAHGAAQKDLPFLPEQLQRRLAQAGWYPETRTLGLVGATVFLTMLLLFALFGFAAAVLLLIAAVASFIVAVNMAAARRMNKLSEALPGFFDRLRQSLIIGNSISVALARATQSSPPIVVEFLAPAMRRIANGAGIAESMAQLAEETELYELHLLSSAIEANLRFGGSLTAILANLIENFRRRKTLEREIRANTAQIRASAQVLAILPLVVGAVVFAKSPDYMRFFVHDATGIKLLAYCIFSQLLGGVLMRSIVRVTY